MGDSAASPFRVSEYKSPSWTFKCTSWQYDRILDRCKFRQASWDSFDCFCGTGDPSGKPSDIIVIQFRYRIGGCHVLPIVYWIKKNAVVGVNLHPTSPIYTELSYIFEQMNPEGTYVKYHLVREVIDVARSLASMPQNAGREGLSFVYEMSALPFSIDSLSRVKFVGGGAYSETQVCAVCLDDISEGDEVIWMPCSHIYHGQCILSWLERKPTCPTCLFTLPMNNY